AYGLEKLTESSEFEIAVRRHAEYFRDLFERAEPEPAMRPTAERIATYGQRINDVRAALEWAFSPGGDATIGVALTIASEPLWSGLSLMDEWRRRVEAALASIRPGAGGSTRREMQLLAALGVAMFFTIGPRSKAGAAWADVLEIAERLATAGMAQPTSTPSRPPTNLPEPVSELIGRDVELDEILDLSTSHRLVTLVGPGGIGKTRLSSEVARHLLPRFVDGVWVAELAPLSDPELVSAAVATTLGLDLAGGPVSPERVANGLGSKQLMLVLDNCEHVADAVAEMVEALLRANPGTRVIATSREPLRVEGEWIYPVPL